jgi:hypothetical protein
MTLQQQLQHFVLMGNIPACERMIRANKMDVNVGDGMLLVVCLQMGHVKLFKLLLAWGGKFAPYKQKLYEAALQGGSKAAIKLVERMIWQLEQQQ